MPQTNPPPRIYAQTISGVNLWSTHRCQGGQAYVLVDAVEPLLDVYQRVYDATDDETRHKLCNAMTVLNLALSIEKQEE